MRPAAGLGVRVWQVVRVGLIAYLLVVLGAMLLENRLIFFPFPYPAGEWQPSGLQFEDAWFQAADGTKLHGWYLPRPEAVAAVLFCHGNAGNITHRAHVLEALTRQVGVSVLIFDYRGYGRSEGRPSEQGVLADARAARDWLAKRENLSPNEIVLMGESIGGAIATIVAGADGAKALILESTFNNLPDVAAYHYPWLPVRWLMRSRFDAAAAIKHYHGPVMQVHGDADTIVPLQFGRRLFEAANEPKRFLLLPGHDHNDLMPLKYYEALADFLRSIGKRPQ